MSDQRFGELLSRLSAGDVRFVIIGGLAVGAWGVVRGTKDLDIVPASDRANLSRLAETVINMGGRVQLAESLVGSAPSLLALLVEGERVVIETEFGPLDVVQGLDGVPSFEHLDANAEEADVLGAKVRVCSLADLRAMKRSAGRHRDQADLEDLDAANEDR